MRTLVLAVGVVACGACGGRGGAKQAPDPVTRPARDSGQGHLAVHARALGAQLAACHAPDDPGQLVLGHACRDALRQLVAGCGTADLQQVARTDAISEPCKASLRALLPEADSVRSRLLVLGSARVAGGVDLFVAASDERGEPLELTQAGCEPTAPPSASLVTSLEVAGRVVAVESTVASLPVHCERPLFSAASILDYSGSMSDRDVEESIAIFRALYAALPAGCLESDVRIFSTTVRERHRFTAVPRTLDRAVAHDPTMPRASTALLDALGDGVRSVGARPAPVRLVVVATDGIENASERWQEPALIAAARATNVRIVSFGSLLSDSRFLEQLGTQTGGAFVFRADPALLAVAARNVGRLLASTRRVRIIDPRVSRATDVLLAFGDQQVRVPLR